MNFYAESEATEVIQTVIQGGEVGSSNEQVHSHHVSRGNNLLACMHCWIADVDS
jgi:hypothetical protein